MEVPERDSCGTTNLMKKSQKNCSLCAKFCHIITLCFQKIKNATPVRHTPDLDFFHEQLKLTINYIIYGFYGQFSLLMKEKKSKLILHQGVCNLEERKTRIWLDLFQSITNLSNQILEQDFIQSDQNGGKKVLIFHVHILSHSLQPKLL